MIEQGYTYEEIAVELRRTYAAVTNLISQLRKDGTLPPHEDDMSWLTKTCGLLTSAECAELVAA
jgi:transposase